MKAARRSALEVGPGMRAWARLRRNRAAMAGGWLLIGTSLLCFVLPMLLGLASAQSRSYIDRTTLLLMSSIVPISMKLLESFSPSLSTAISSLC